MSYCTIAEADEYVESHYLSTDSKRTLWEEQDDESKQILLNRSHDTIELLPFTGRKTSCSQTEVFPRNGDTEVPDKVKYAEIELAVSLTDSETKETQDQYKNMIDYGIGSYSIGNFSETLLTYSKKSMALQYGLVSTEAENLLQPWLYGGYRIE